MWFVSKGAQQTGPSFKSWGSTCVSSLSCCHNSTLPTLPLCPAKPSHIVFLKHTVSSKMGRQTWVWPWLQSELTLAVANTVLAPDLAQGAVSCGRLTPPWPRADCKPGLDSAKRTRKAAEETMVGLGQARGVPPRSCGGLWKGGKFGSLRGSDCLVVQARTGKGCLNQVQALSRKELADRLALG